MLTCDYCRMWLWLFSNEREREVTSRLWYLVLLCANKTFATLSCLSNSNRSNEGQIYNTNVRFCDTKTLDFCLSLQRSNLCYSWKGKLTQYQKIFKIQKSHKFVFVVLFRVDVNLVRFSVIDLMEPSSRSQSLYQCWSGL